MDVSVLFMPFSNSIDFTASNLADGSENPVFRIWVKCPVCDQPELACYELKSKSQLIEHDWFFTPIYKPAGGYGEIDFTSIAVTVCPKCLFASPDKHDFVTRIQGSNDSRPSNLPIHILRSLKNGTALRKQAISPGIKLREHFQVPRSHEAALDSYRLSLRRAKTEAMLDNPLANYKSGMYCLKMALLQRQHGENDIQMLQGAAANLERCLLKSELKSAPQLESRTTYALVALFVRCQDFKKAEGYLRLLEKMKMEVSAVGNEDASLSQAIDRHMAMAREIWSQRAETSLWDTYPR